MAPDAGPSALALAAEHAKVPGISIGVVRDGAVTRTEAAGDVKTETALEAASIGKTIIGIAVMQLVEQGKIGLDDDASMHLPFVLRSPTHPKAPITIRMLLTHTSSVHDRMPDLETARDPNLGAFLRGYVQSADAFLDAEPGAKSEYSNAGASLAALAVEKESRRPFDAYVRDAILSPVGAIHAMYRPLHAVYPVVDLWATAGELACLLAAIARGGEIGGARILKPESVATMLGGGLGWQAIDLGGRRLLGHEGEDRTASTAMFFDPLTKTGAVILTNGDAFASGDPTRAKALQDLLSDLVR